MGIVNGTYNGQVPGGHSNSAVAHNELKAELFNDIEDNIQAVDDALEALQTDKVDPIIAFVVSMSRAIQFDPDVYNGPNGTPITVTVKVTTSDGTKIPFSPVTEVTVEINSDTTGGALINGAASPQIVSITEGEGTFTLINGGGGAGVVELGLIDSGASGLDVSDLATVTFT